MRLIFLGLSMVILTGCDAPIRGRMPLKTESLNSPDALVNNNPGFNAGTLATTPVTSPTPVDTNFPNCDLSSKFHTVDIGHFGLCQSTTTETLFKVKFSQTTTTRNCLIPLYKDASGKSTYIGQPQCTAVNTANATIQGSLIKNRQGFESYPLNGVIVMKEPLLPQYFNCMHAYINWLPQACPGGPSSSTYCYQWMNRCPMGGRTDQLCHSGADEYMKLTCNNFKAKYQSTYLDISTK